MEIKRKRHIGVRVKAFLFFFFFFKSLDLSPEACEQKVLERGGMWARNTHALSPQLGMDWLR